MSELREEDMSKPGGHVAPRSGRRLRRLAVPRQPRVSARPADVRAPREAARQRVVPTPAPQHSVAAAKRLLVFGDVIALVASLLLVRVLAGASLGDLAGYDAHLVPLLVLAAWPVCAQFARLYVPSGEYTTSSAADELTRVFRVLTLLTWLALLPAVAFGLAYDLPELATFWVVAIVTLGVARVTARAIIRRNFATFQNTIIVGAGSVGQLIARKILQHREYGINLVGFVDSQPKERRSDLRDLTLLGTPEQLPQLVQSMNVDRIIVAFSNDDSERVITLIRSITKPNLRIDVVPRLFELMGPATQLHAVEGLPLVAISSASVSRTTLRIKRAIDIVGAGLALLLVSPLFAVIALRIKLDSKGPVFFKQVRLGQGMHEFTSLKFRTMRTETPDVQHREYIKSMMTAEARLESNGLFKAERDDVVTKVGRWLRRSSLDELPQLINVLRGDMALVGPRPCIPYEVEWFEPHHFVRFQVPAGLTGFWQVTARARSTFSEALDMDVLYVQSFSLALDLRLMLRTPGQIINHGATS